MASLESKLVAAISTLPVAEGLAFHARGQLLGLQRILATEPGTHTVSEDDDSARAEQFSPEGQFWIRTVQGNVIHSHRTQTKV
jgi:hypothetical protein